MLEVINGTNIINYTVCLRCKIMFFNFPVGLFSTAFHFLKGGFCFLLVVQSFLIMHFTSLRGFRWSVVLSLLKKREQGDSCCLEGLLSDEKDL